MERKALTVELKADQPGALTAVFATLNVIDLDSDVTLPGAFETGAETRLLPAHDWAHYMIGKGVIEADDEQAVFNGMFNLATDAGRNWYESLKFDLANGKPLQEFSYGFDVLDSSPGEFQGRPVRFLRKLRVHEVSPVTLGAGVGTRTLGLKGADGQPVPFQELFDYYYAHPDEAAAFLAGLSGDGAITDPPAASTSGDDQDGSKFADQAEHVLADVQAFVARAAGLASLRAKAGRTFSAANVGRLNTIADEVGASAEKLRELLTQAEPAKTAAPAEVLREFLRHEHLRARRLGVAV